MNEMSMTKGETDKLRVAVITEQNGFYKSREKACRSLDCHLVESVMNATEQVEPSLIVALCMKTNL